MRNSDRLSYLRFLQKVVFVALVLWSASCGHKAPSDEPGRAYGATTSCGAIGNPLALTPKLECVATDSTGAKHAVWGYGNTASSTITVAAGPLNKLSPGPVAQGQPVVFRATPGAAHVFVTPLPPTGTLTWQLGSGTASASASSPACTVWGDEAVFFGSPSIIEARVPLHDRPETELTGTLVATDVIDPGVPQGEEHTAANAELEGVAAVNPDGSASYTLPLWVPEGRAGIKPNLTLSYNSRGGNGLLGVGWGLAAESAIRRCPRARPSSARKAPVTFESSDDFCLNGDHLIPIGTTENGDFDYRPEHDPGIRVRAHGDTGGAVGPATWKAFLPDGRIRLYGKRLVGSRSTLTYSDLDANPAVESFTPGFVLAWALSREEDRNGNALELEYFDSTECDGPSPPSFCGAELASHTAQLRLRTIRYTTGPAHPSPDRRIEFDYVERPDVSRSALSGVMSMQAHVLANIRVYGPDPIAEGLLRTYRFEYNWQGKIPGELYLLDTSGRTSPTERSLLVAARQCAPDTAHGSEVCSRRLRFDWNIFTVGARPAGVVFNEKTLDASLADDLVPPALVTGDAAERHFALIVADLDRDGKDDILYRHLKAPAGSSGCEPEGCSIHRYEWLWRRSTGEGFGAAKSAGLPPEIAHKNHALPKPVINPIPDTFGRSSLAFPQQGWGLRSGVSDGEAPFWRLFDFSGDKFVEITYPTAFSQTDGDPAPWPPCSTFSEGGDHELNRAFCGNAPAPLYFGDFAGTNLASVVRPFMSASGMQWFRSPDPGRTTGAYSLFSAERPTSVLITAEGRWNIFENVYSVGSDGSGLTYLLHPAAGSRRYVRTAVDIGPLRTSLPTVSATAGTAESHYLFADIDGDGAADAIRIPNTGGNALLAYARGNDYAPFVPANVDLTAAGWAFGAVDGLSPDPGIRVADFDGDGRDDLVVFNADSPSFEGGDPVRVTPVIWRGTGHHPSSAAAPALEPMHTARRLPDGSIKSNFGSTRRAVANGTPYSHVIDVNGDGRPDLITFETNGSPKLYINAESAVDEISEVRTGHGRRTQFRYAASQIVGGRRVGSDITTYVKGLRHVTELAQESNAGRMLRTTYEFSTPYASIRTGFRGYFNETIRDHRGRVEEIDYDFGTSADAALVESKYFTDLWPKFVRVTQTVDIRTLIAETTYSHEVVNGEVLVAKTDTREFVVTGPGAPKVLSKLSTTTNTFDSTPGYARILSSRQSVTGIDSTATTEISYADYDDHAATWLIRRPQTIVVTKSDGGETGVRSRFLKYEPTSNAIAEASDDPGPSHTTQTFARNDEGQVTTLTIVGNAGSTRQFAFFYDEFNGNTISKTIDPTGLVTKRVRHPGLGVVRSVFAPDGAISRFEYDRFGRLKAQSTNDGSRRTLTYRVPGKVTPADVLSVVTDGNDGTNTEVVLDWLGRVQRKYRRDPTGSRYSGEYFTYDENFPSLVVFASRPAFDVVGPATKIAYDSVGRPIRLDPIGGGATTLSYDEYTNTVLTSVEAGAGVQWSRTRRDVLGRVVSKTALDVVSMAGSPEKADVGTAISYGPFDALRTVVGPTGELRIDYTDATFARRATVTDPNTGTTRFAYDDLGQLAHTEDADGRITTLERDAAGRVLEERSTTDGASCFYYDGGSGAQGHLSKVVSPFGVSTSLDYDAIGRLTRTTQTVDGTDYALSYGFDTIGRLSTINYPAPGIAPFGVRYSYSTGDGSLTSVEDSTVPAGTKVYWRAVDRAPDSQLVEELYLNSVQTHSEYDDSGRLRARMIASPIEGRVLDETYAYDVKGLLTERRDLNGGRVDRYGYDSLDRLTSWSGTGYALPFAEAYQYDHQSNLREKQGAITEKFEPSALHPSAVGRDGSGDYAYNASGDLISDPARTITPAAFHLPKEIGTAAGVTSLYYDGLHSRVKKFSAADGRTTITVGGVYEREIVGSVSEHIFNVFAGGKLVAQERWTQGSGGLTKQPVSLIHTDRLGSPMMVTNSSGAVAERIAHAPFGARVNPEVPTDESSSALRHGFTGHQHDAELSLIDMGGRIYDPHTARFLSPDPIVADIASPLGLNRYAYVDNDPLNAVDPSGFTGEPAPSGPPKNLTVWGYKPGKTYTFGPGEPVDNWPFTTPVGSNWGPEAPKPAAGNQSDDNGSAIAASIALGRLLGPPASALTHIGGLVRWHAQNMGLPCLLGSCWSVLPTTAQVAPYLAESVLRTFIDAGMLALELYGAVTGIGAALELGAGALAGEAVFGSAWFAGGAAGIADAAEVTAIAAAEGGAAAADPLASAAAESGIAQAAPTLSVDADLLATYGPRVPTQSGGFFNVVTHADASAAYVVQGGSYLPISHRTLATFIQRSPGYTGQPVRLIACQAGACGTGLAQNLANKLGVAVQAPTGPALVDSWGRFWTTGSWRTFTPGL